jgi:hypothetical protein
MASYTYKSWQTINMPTVSTDTYFRILDHTSTSPQDEVEGILYDGLILGGFYIQNLNEILSQYVNPSTISFFSSLQENSGGKKTFYIYYTSDNWQTFTSDDVTIIYDWGYETDMRTTLSAPISNLVDVRQYLLYSVRPQTVPTNLVAKIGNIVQDAYVLDQSINYDYVKYLLDIDEWPGEFDFGYSYDYLVTRNSLVPGTFAEFTIGSDKFIVSHTCYRYCIYYFNQYGGWDSILFAGKTIQNDNLSRLSYKKNYVAGSTEFNKVNYLTTIQENWQLNTSFLGDLSSQKMINMMASNCLYLHDLEENKIIPINITNSKCEHKTYKNQGRKLYTYTIEVSASQPKYRI